jgi:hypothetical protein
MAWLIGVLATQVSVVTDQVWLVDSTPVECGRSRETAKRSDLRGYAEYGYCASHTRYFLGFRLHLIATVHGIPIAWALTGAKADEREVLDAMLDRLPLDLARRIRDSLQRQALRSCQVVSVVDRVDRNHLPHHHPAAQTAMCRSTCRPPSQTRSAPGRPSSTTKEARVDTGASE